MPNLRYDPPPEGIEAELFDALERLKEGAPNNPDLKRKASMGRLRINPTTVAREAGRARTLCAYKDCAYPRVREAIDLYKMHGAKPPTSFEDLNDKLTRENGELKETVVLAMSRVSAMILRVKNIDEKARKEVANAERKARNNGNVTSLEQIAESLPPTKEDVVIPMKHRQRRKRPLHQ